MKPWRERLDWTGERSPSNAERLKAAEAEIKDLRKEIARLERLEKNAQDRINKRLESTRARANFWRKLNAQQTQRKRKSASRPSQRATM